MEAGLYKSDPLSACVFSTLLFGNNYAGVLGDLSVWDWLCLGDMMRYCMCDGCSTQTGVVSVGAPLFGDHYAGVLGARPHPCGVEEAWAPRGLYVWCMGTSHGWEWCHSIHTGGVSLAALPIPPPPHGHGHGVNKWVAPNGVQKQICKINKTFLLQ